MHFKFLFKFFGFHKTTLNNRTDNVSQCTMKVCERLNSYNATLVSGPLCVLATVFGDNVNEPKIPQQHVSPQVL